MKRSTDSWNKIKNLRQTPIQYFLQQNRFGTGEDETIQREEDVRRHVGGMPLLTDLGLAMRTDPLALIRGATEFVTVIYGPAVTFAFPDVKVEVYRRSVLHLNLIPIPKFPDGARSEEQGPSSSGKNPKCDDGQGGSRRSEEPMKQDPDQAKNEVDKALTGGMSSLDFNFLSDFENGTDTLEAMTEPADEGASKLEPPSAFMGTNRNLPNRNS